MALGNVSDIYKGITGHAPDQAGLEYWTGKQRAGEDIGKAITGAINPTNTASWASGQTKTYNPMTDVDKNYSDLYGKTGDAPGRDYWSKDVSSGRLLPSELRGAMVNAGGPPNQTLKTPGFVDNQAAMNAGIPSLFNRMTGNMDRYDKAYDRLEGLPGQIDEWTDEALKSQRMTGDMSQGIMNRVAGQRAGGGIMGGTEAQNLEANEAARLNQIILENQNKIRQTANQLKAGTIQGLPGQALQPVQMGLGLYGTTANEAATWGNMALQSLLKGY